MRESFEMHNRTRYPAYFALFLMAYYVTNSVFQGFMTLYFENTLHFDAGQRGAILAGFAIVSAIAQPFWGMRGDRMKSRNTLIRILCVISSLVILCLLFVRSYFAVMAVICLFACFYMSIQPIGDSVILEALQQHDQPFGPIRLAGGLSFAVFSMAFGAIINKGNRDIWAIYFTAGLLCVTCLATLALPTMPGHQAMGGKKLSFAKLLKMKDLMLLLAFSMPIQITMGYFYAFFSNHFVNGLEGGNKALLGWCYFISAVSEIPYLLFSDRLFKKIGAGKLLCISALTLTARWLFVAISDNYLIVMFSQVLHGWGFIVMTVSVAKYISLTVPAELKASGQILLGVVSFGISRAIGNLGGGLLADYMGMQKVYYVCAAICIVSFICFAPYFLKREPLNGQTSVSKA